MEQKERWQRYAEKLGVSISKFVIEYVENSMRKEEEPSYKSRGALWKENSELRQQVKDLARKYRILEKVVDRLEEELRRYRAKPFLEKFEGVRRYETELVNLLSLDKYVLKKLLRYLTNDRGYSVKTLENYFSVISTFCDYLAYEGLADRNPVLPFRKRYIRQYKADRHNTDPSRKLISLEQMRILINSILDPRDKAIVTLLAKTGIRRKELINIDIDDINWAEQSIQLKPHPKRSNLLVFFDDECARVLRRWLNVRRNYNIALGCMALFVGERGERLERHGVYRVVTKCAERVGLYDPKSKRMEDHFTPHCCRHWFTTHLRRNGLKREYLKELRGDARKEAVDIYDHIDRKELRRAYLAAVPLLGIG